MRSSRSDKSKPGILYKGLTAILFSSVLGFAVLSGANALNDDGAMHSSVGLWAFLLCGAVMALWFKVSISHPFSQLSKMVKSNLDSDPVEVAACERRADELGELARGIAEVFQQKRNLDEQNAQLVPRGLAFEAAPAALMILDPSGRVTAANACCETLMNSLEFELSSVWQGFELGKLIGTNIAVFVGEQALKTEGIVKLELGGKAVELHHREICDSAGSFSGTVIEWRDLSETGRAKALADAVDATRAVFEFRLNGVVLNPNAAMQRILNAQSGTKGSLTAIFEQVPAPEENIETIVSKIAAGHATRGRFALTDGIVLEGSFSPIRASTGEVSGGLFIGLDVTEAERERVEEAKAKQRDSKIQGNVVETLGIALKALAKGKLDHQISQPFEGGYDQLRQDFNSAISALGSVVGGVVTHTRSINGETEEIRAASDELSQRTQKQAATLEETAAALNELTASVRFAADNAQVALQQSLAAKTSAEEGGEIARSAIAAMDCIKKSSEGISKITSVIDDIAFQTNLLALNAGVEAARAGDAGRGFAVVATEVRALAQRSSDAAREINAIVSESSEQVNSGVELVDRTGGALSNLVSSIAEISAKFTDIATSSQEQSSTLGEINEAVTELDQLTQENVAMFEQTKAASHILSAEADALASAVGVFGVDRAAYQTGIPKPATPCGLAAAQPVVSPGAVPVKGNAALEVEYEENLDDGWEEF